MIQRSILQDSSSVVDTTELSAKVQDLKANITENAIRIVHQVMPTKVLYLNDLFTIMPAFNVDLSAVRKKVVIDVSSSSAENGKNKKRKLNSSEESKESDSLPVAEPDVLPNPIILEILSSLKKEILDLIEVINTVKIWIQLNIPRIEDGNNFGVSIQEETVNELGRAEDSGFAVLESVTKYFVTRAKLVSKVQKYPNILDYRQSVMELDEKEFINLRLCCLDLRNNYAILHDMIIKNLEKIKTPRTSHHNNLML